MIDGPEWFAPKRYGYGAGRPISWQGWALTSAFIILAVPAGLLARYSPTSSISVLFILTVAFTLICMRTTRGGWRWRWGEKG